MGSRIRENPKRMFEFFVEVTKTDDKAPTISRRFPATYSDEGVVTEIPKFAFPCETDGAQVEHFSFVVPDLSGMFRFGFCRHATGHQSCLCVVSWLPWFDTFYKMLDHISKLITSGDQSDLREFLQEIYDHDIPGAKVPVSIIAAQQMFNFTAPDPSELPRIPGNINLTEYYNALDSANMMLVFASMLQERRIYMMSKRLNRLTSCIHAAEALLYPLNWQHTFIPVLPGYVIECLGLMTPYIIGVHGNLLPRLDELQEDLEDTVCVDLDNNTVTSDHDDLSRLPWNVVNALKKDLKAEKLKDSMQKTGDALSMAFLKAIVRLIGGYKEALKIQPDQPVTFDEKLFIHSRPSSSFHLYLEGMLSLQLFQEFIHARMDLLNAGVKLNDIFEQQVVAYAERHKKKNKSNFKELKVKIKKQSRRAISSVISGLLVDSEDKKGDKLKDGSEGLSTKFQHGVSFSNPNDTTQHKPFAASIGPPQKSHVRPKSAMFSRELSQDDSGVSLSYQSPNMSLLDDLDIQEVLRKSPSSEILGRQDVGKLSSASSSSSLDESDSSFTSPRNDPKKTERTVKRAPSDPGSVPKDKLVRPGGGDKLIRPAKTNIQRQSAGKSSPLSRLLSSRRSRDYATLDSQVDATPAGRVNVKATPELPTVTEKEHQNIKSVSEVTTNEIEIKGASSSNVCDTEPQLLIDLGSNDVTSPEDILFDPLVAAGAESKMNLDLESILSQSGSQAKGGSDGLQSLDLFGSVDFASYTPPVAGEHTPGSNDGHLVTGTTVKGSKFAGDNFQSSFNPQKLPVHNNNIGFAGYNSHQSNQMAGAASSFTNSKPSSLSQPGMNLTTTPPSFYGNSSSLFTPAFNANSMPASQTQYPSSLYRPQTLSSPITANQFHPGPSQSGTATVSSVFAARARDSRGTAATSNSSVKSQADLLSELIGVEFSSGSNSQSQPKFQPR